MLAACLPPPRYVNDCAASSGVASDCDPNQNPANAVDITLTVNLASWGLPPGTLLPVVVAGPNSMGEVQALAPVQPGGSVTVFAPSGSTLLITGQISGSQSVLPVLTSDDATISPGGSTLAGNTGLLTVATSTTADHSTTFVSLLKFAIPAAATPSSLTAAILELTVAQAASQKSVLTVLGSACDAQWSESTVTWSAATAFAINASVPMTSQITSLTQNFNYFDSSTVVAGHITVLPTTAVGTVLRIDIGDYAASCAGKTVTLSISRRFRNPLYTGNAVGNIPADTLSGGASVQFYSGEAATGVPVLRLLSSSSLATGVMSLTVPGSSVSTPAGRHLLASGPGAAITANISQVLTNLLKVPVDVSVTSYSIYFDITVNVRGAAIPQSKVAPSPRLRRTTTDAAPRVASRRTSRSPSTRRRLWTSRRSSPPSPATSANRTRRMCVSWVSSACLRCHRWCLFLSLQRTDKCGIPAARRRCATADLHQGRQRRRFCQRHEDLRPGRLVQ